jgi:hypothetical protein
MSYPVFNTVYTFREIVSLDLPDIPFLQFVYNDKSCVIQTSHITNEALLTIPGMSESKWKFERITREYIPLFWYADDNIQALVDIKETKNAYWVTPKGYPRESI